MNDLTDATLTTCETMKNVITASSFHIHTLIFSSRDGEEVGKFNFYGPEMTFEGNIDKSGEVFVNYICGVFNAKIKNDIKKATEQAVADYEEVLADKRRLTRELDVLLNGAGAARQASLCDLVGQVQQEGIRSKLYTPKKSD